MWNTIQNERGLGARMIQPLLLGVASYLLYLALTPNEEGATGRNATTTETNNATPNAANPSPQNPNDGAGGLVTGGGGSGGGGRTFVDPFAPFGGGDGAWGGGGPVASLPTFVPDRDSQPEGRPTGGRGWTVDGSGAGSTRGLSPEERANLIA